MRAHVLLALVAVVASACDDGAGAGAADTADLQALDPVARGRSFVDARGCAACHQDPGAPTLSGSTRPRDGTMAYPANLTPDEDTGIGGWSDEEIVRAMRTGVDDEEAPLCPPMPHFDGTGGDGRAMDDDEANAIVAYLRSLPPAQRGIPESSCPPLKSPPPDDAPPDLAIPAAPPDLGLPADLATSD